MISESTKRVSESNYTALSAKQTSFLWSKDSKMWSAGSVAHSYLEVKEPKRVLVLKDRASFKLETVETEPFRVDGTFVG